jgi:hypothetical protein
MSPEDLLASVEMQRLLVDLVLALEEPYRSAVLCRYFQGLEPARIAQDLDIRAGTIRWRLSEGLSQLRAALDDRLANRGIWRRALAPIGLCRSQTKGVIVVMTTKTKVGLAVALTMATLAGGRMAWRRMNPISVPRGGLSAASIEKTGMGAATVPPGRESAAAAPTVAGTESPPHRAPPRIVTPAPPAAPPASPDETHGTMNKEDIRTGIRSIIPGLKDCYSRLLEREPRASGRINIKFNRRPRWRRTNLRRHDRSAARRRRDARTDRPAHRAVHRQRCRGGPLRRANRRPGGHHLSVLAHAQPRPLPRVRARAVTQKGLSRPPAHFRRDRDVDVVLAIEPILNVGAGPVRVLDDGWTVLTGDHSLSAHMEHTVAITDGGPLVLTA